MNTLLILLLFKFHEFSIFHPLAINDGSDLIEG